MYHCAQLDCFFCVDVYLGATSIILPGPDPAALLAAIAREQVTKLFCPPTVWISLLRHPDFAATDLSSLRKGYYGASPMPVEILRELQRRLPDVQLWNFYGQTEMAPVATILGPAEQLQRAGSAGRAALNVETLIVDDGGNPVPPGRVGEIVHRSPHAALGYFNDEEKTAGAFRGGWFHSGDLGVMTEDGYLSVVDRKKDMIKRGGENVASREVEEAIYELDGVAEVAVFGIGHPRWIEAVTAVVIPKAGASATAEGIQAHIKDRLAGYKRPKYVVLAEELPKNPWRPATSVDSDHTRITGHRRNPMVTKYQKFGDGYKAEAVKLYRESNQTIAETARNLGLKESTLANWVKKDKDNEAVAVGEAPLTPAERTRIRELEADVRRLNMENAFLKKASAYFASQNL